MHHVNFENIYFLDSRDGIIEMNGSKICLLHDTVHMSKSFRNLLMSYKLKLDYKKAIWNPKIPRKFVFWKYYEKAYNMDLNSRLFMRHIPKITESHVRINKVKKTKVIYCCQLFSRSMAEWIKICAALKGKCFLI